MSSYNLPFSERRDAQMSSDPIPLSSPIKVLSYRDRFETARRGSDASTASSSGPISPVTPLSFSSVLPRAPSQHHKYNPGQYTGLLPVSYDATPMLQQVFPSQAPMGGGRYEHAPSQVQAGYDLQVQLSSNDQFGSIHPRIYHHHIPVHSPAPRRLAFPVDILEEEDENDFIANEGQLGDREPFGVDEWSRQERLLLGGWAQQPASEAVQSLGMAVNLAPSGSVPGEENEQDLGIIPLANQGKWGDVPSTLIDESAGPETFTFQFPEPATTAPGLASPYKRKRGSILEVEALEDGADGELPCGVDGRPLPIMRFKTEGPEAPSQRAISALYANRPQGDGEARNLGRQFSDEFPERYRLTKKFCKAYGLQAQIGSGGFGFVMTAVQYATNVEVAVKFIVKSKLPFEHLVKDPLLGGFVPMEAFVLRHCDHVGIVKFVDFYEDGCYYYLVQELHGSPWEKTLNTKEEIPAATLRKALSSKPPVIVPLKAKAVVGASSTFFQFPPKTPGKPTGLSTPDPTPSAGNASYATPIKTTSNSFRFPAATTYNDGDVSSSPFNGVGFAKLGLLTPPENSQPPPLSRRPSHDLFECIEQHKKFGEAEAQKMFKQVVAAVSYMHSLGISHRDIKDENLLVDSDFNVKLIDFGSAVVRDMEKPEPYYHKFFGTITFASAEILNNQPYRAEPAEIWTLGVLLAFLVTGESPFPSDEHAMRGCPVFSDYRRDGSPCILSYQCMDLVKGCLHADPDQRFTIEDVVTHPWLQRVFF